MNHDFQLPAALEDYRRERRWIVHRNKVPYQPDNPSRKAKPNDPATWSKGDIAINVAVELDFSGIGLMLKDGEIGVMDIDHCRNADTGVIDPYTQQLVARANTLTEISPSGTGLHLFGVYSGELKKDRTKQPVPGANGVSVDSFFGKEGRYITITGNRLNNTPDDLNDITALMDSTVAELDAANGRANNNEERQRDQQQTGSTDIPRAIAALLFIANGGAGNPHAGYASRGPLLFAFVTKALLARVSAEAIIEACLEEAHRGCAIREHCRENGDRSYVERQIKQARDGIGEGNDARITEINKDHALVLVGDKSVVMRLEGRTEFRLLKVGAFKQWFSNEQVPVGRTIGP
jgi:hypothetical protein